MQFLDKLQVTINICTIKKLGYLNSFLQNIVYLMGLFSFYNNLVRLLQ